MVAQPVTVDQALSADAVKTSICRVLICRLLLASSCMLVITVMDVLLTLIVAWDVDAVRLAYSM